MIPRTLQAALEHDRAGRWGEAESMCRGILAVDATNLDALRLLDAVSRQLGKPELADDLINRAIDYQPADPVLLNHLGIALKGVGRWEQAVRSFRAALAVQPDFADTYNNLGNTLQDLGRLEEAEQCYLKALALVPGHIAVHGNLGLALQRSGRFSDAEKHFRRALALNTDSAEAHNYLGNLLQQLGRWSEAEQALRAALTIKPGYADAHNNLGIVLNNSGSIEEAEQCFRNALALNSDAAEAHGNLGLVLERLGRYAEAEQSCRKAIALNPHAFGPHSNLGIVLRRLGKMAEAEECFRKALALNPGFAEAQAHWINLCQVSCIWSEALEQAILDLRKKVARQDSPRISPFTFIALPGTDAIEHYQFANQFATKEFGESFSRPYMYGADPRPSHAKLRIGFLSADFQEHATSYLLAEVLERHDRSRFELVGYSFGPDDNSPIRNRICAAFGMFRDIKALGHEASARQIVTDEIDILVDLKGYTGQGRTQIVALRPAPIQVNWLGYPGTFGHPRLADYLIGDPIVTPLEHAAYYSESLALMPHCYQPNDRQRAIGPRPTRAEAGLPEEGFVFCSFNQPYKITPFMFDLWCQLLREVPGSVLWLLQPNLVAQNNLWREGLARGVARNRIMFAPILPLEKHLGRLQLADLCVDTYPYTSHTTASDALWAGVPLVTLMGSTFVSRVAASILSAARLPDLVTHSAASYYRLALELATQREKLGNIRKAMATNRLTCALFDSEQFTRDIERLYGEMWDAYRSGIKGHIVLKR
jgi:predicted O-linked N-acetylglucosamine transferase (SPINDLY family)